MPEIDMGKVVGPQGEQGIQGIPGIQGPPGAPATINGENTLTLTPGPNVELRQAGTNLEIGAVVPGKNLLKNWDFRKPVNRNGKTEYVTKGYTIDRWMLGNKVIKATVKDGYLRIERTAETANPAFGEVVDSPNQYSGKTATISVVYRTSVDKIIRMGFYITAASTGGKDYHYILPAASDWACASLTVNMPPEILYIEARPCQIYSAVPVGGYIDILAAKLELGDHQTLARQNEDGEWEIIDPPDYDLQYLLCSQYSPITGEWVGLQHSNPNLVDNWYLANPINEKGQTEYQGNVYTIDRWKQDSGTMVLQNGYITISNNIYQKIPKDEAGSLLGQTITLSALYNDNTIVFGSITLPATWPSTTTVMSATDHLMIAFESNDMQIFRHQAYTKGIVAVKAELGPVQTLAHKEGDTWVLNDPPPNKAVELAKCQWYYRYLGVRRVPAWEITTDHFSYCVNYDPIMRINPTVRIDADPSKIYLASNKSYDLSGFVFSVDWSVDGAVKIRATKAQHGIPLDDPPLLAIQSNTVELGNR